MAERTEAVERNAILLAAMLPESPKTGRVILQKMPEGLFSATPGDFRHPNVKKTPAAWAFLARPFLPSIGSPRTRIPRRPGECPLPSEAEVT
jgi:hypothetical protein